MAARIPKKTQRREMDFPEASGNIVPPESTTTVLLKTMMDMKESFGKLKSDIEQLHASVKEVEAKQKTIDRTLQDVKTAGKTILAVVSIVSVVIGLVKYGPSIVEFFSKVTSQ